MKPIHEVIKYTHEGIDVYVKINYLKQQISLVDVKGNRMRDVQDKLFRFNNTNGEKWLKIMDAMKHATWEAIDRLDNYIEKNNPPLNVPNFNGDSTAFVPCSFITEERELTRPINSERD